jgi:DNA-binding NtrC family response regulator
MIYDAVSAHTSGILSMKSFRKVLNNKQKGTQDLAEDMMSGELQWLQSFNPLPNLKQAESVLIREAMKQAKGNQTIAAQLLGITRQTLINKLKKLSDFIHPF